jgi:hypothetical protein
LKSALLQETPWVMEAKTEAAQKKNLGLLFDLGRMSNEMNTTISKLSEAQLSNGGFAGSRAAQMIVTSPSLFSPASASWRK